MTPIDNTLTRAPTTNALASLRALLAGSTETIADALEVAERQAQLFADLMCQSSGRISSRITKLIPSIRIDYIDGMPLAGTAFWARKKWHIHVRAGDPVSFQEFTVLHELKHIVDHPLRELHPHLLSEGDWEGLANYFAARVLAAKENTKG